MKCPGRNRYGCQGPFGSTRPSLEVEYDTGQISRERRRVQLSLLLLFTAYTSSRPGALVESGMYAGTNEGLQYRDIHLGLFPGNESKAELVMEVTLLFTKGERNGKPYVIPPRKQSTSSRDYRNTYVIHLNDETPPCVRYYTF